MTRRGSSRWAPKQISALSDLARLQAVALDQRLAPGLLRIEAIKTDIADLGKRRMALIASQSSTEGIKACAETQAFIYAGADALRLDQARLYRELARTEADTAKLRTEAARAHARLAVLEKLAKR
jgi:hypothetical protein